MMVGGIDRVGGSKTVEWPVDPNDTVDNVPLSLARTPPFSLPAAPPPDLKCSVLLASLNCGLGDGKRLWIGWQYHIRFPSFLCQR
jgi:hypothetical protein